MDNETIRDLPDPGIAAIIVLILIICVPGSLIITGLYYLGRAIHRRFS